MEIRLAESRDTNRIISFFEEHLDPANDAIYSPEFLCPSGIKAAIRRRMMVVTVDNGKIIGALRFYKRKKKGFSLYQFAIDHASRGSGLLLSMLASLSKETVYVKCPKGSVFNEYYAKTGWNNYYEDGTFTYWMLAPCIAQEVERTESFLIKKEEPL